MREKSDEVEHAACAAIAELRRVVPHGDDAGNSGVSVWIQGHVRDSDGVVSDSALVAADFDGCAVQVDSDVQSGVEDH